MRGISLRLLLPILLLGVLLAEFALSWWPWVELEAIRSGRPSGYVLGPALKLNGPGFIYFATLACSIAVACWIVVRLGVPQRGRWPFVLIALALIVYTLGPTMNWLRWGREGEPPPWLITNTAYIVVALTFKILALVALYLTFRVDSIRAVGDGKQRLSFATVIAVALALYVVLPLWDAVLALANIFWVELIHYRASPTGEHAWIGRLGRAGVAVAIAVIFLALGRRSGILRYGSHMVWSKVSFWLFVAYLLLVPVAFVLGAIPYGGGRVPDALRLLVTAAQLFGLLAIGAMLARRAPAMQALNAQAARDSPAA